MENECDGVRSGAGALPKTFGHDKCHRRGGGERFDANHFGAEKARMQRSCSDTIGEAAAHEGMAPNIVV